MRARLRHTPSLPLHTAGRVRAAALGKHCAKHPEARRARPRPRRFDPQAQEAKGRRRAPIRFDSATQSPPAEPRGALSQRAVSQTRPVGCRSQIPEILISETSFVRDCPAVKLLPFDASLYKARFASRAPSCAASGSMPRGGVSDSGLGTSRWRKTRWQQLP